MNLKGKQGSSPKEVDDLCLTQMGNFIVVVVLLLILLLLRPSPLRSQPRGADPKAAVWVSGVGF